VKAVKVNKYISTYPLIDVGSRNQERIELAAVSHSCQKVLSEFS
jgi:hypothetical protein